MNIDTHGSVPDTESATALHLSNRRMQTAYSCREVGTDVDLRHFLYWCENLLCADLTGVELPIL